MENMGFWILMVVFGTFVKTASSTVPVFIGSLAAREMSQIHHSLEMAVEDVNSDLTILSDVILYLNVTTNVEDHEQVYHAIDRMMASGCATVFTSKPYCEIMGALTSLYQRVAISHTCSQSWFYDKIQFPTFIRTHPTDVQVVESVLALIKHMNWNDVVLIGQKSQDWLVIMDLLQTFSLSYGIDIERPVVFEDVSVCCKLKKTCCRNSWFSHLIQKIGGQAGEEKNLARFLQTLSDWNLANGKESVVISLDLEDIKFEKPSEFNVWKTTNVYEMRETVALMDPEDVQSWDVGSMTDRATTLVTIRRKDPGRKFFEFFNRLQAFITKDNNAIINFGSYRAVDIYDAVWIFARALDSILKDQRITGRDHVTRTATNGTALYQIITSGQNFTSVTGEAISFDSDGNSRDHFVALAIDPWTDQFDPRRSSRPSILLGSFYVDSERLTVFRPCSSFREWIPPDFSRNSEADAVVCLPFSPWDRLLFQAALISVAVALTSLWAPVFFRQLGGRQRLFRTIRPDLMAQLKTHLPNYMVVVNDSLVDRSRISDGKEWRIEGWMKFLETTRSVSLEQDVDEVRRMRRLFHPNVNRMLYAFVGFHRIVLVGEFCTERSLWDLLLAGDDRLADETVVESLVYDLVKGMDFVHQSNWKIHGNLKSRNCLVDSHLVLKVADFGLHSYRTFASDESQLWTAPELLRDQHSPGTQTGDVYSFGIILHEILGRCGPFGIWNRHTLLRNAKDIVDIVKQGPQKHQPRYRPPLQCVMENASKRTDPALFWCMKECWRENPSHRPKSFAAILQGLQGSSTGKESPMDGLLRIAVASDYKGYRRDLLNAAVLKEKQLLRKRNKRVETLISQIRPTKKTSFLPKSVDQLSIIVVDIVHYTEISSRLSPIEVMYLLDDVSTVFDEICQRYGCSFKIGTIGDAYIAAGLGESAYRSVFEVNTEINASNQAVQIARMAQEFLAQIQQYHVPQVGKPLTVRIGIHKGPAVLGVFGWYWIIGHSLSMAFAMQSQGCGSSIQISKAFYQELIQSGQFSDELDPPPTSLSHQRFKGYWLRPKASTEQNIERSIHPLKLCYRGSLMSLPSGESLAITFPPSSDFE